MENTSTILYRACKLDLKANESREHKQFSKFTKVMTTIVVLHIVVISALYSLGMSLV